MNLLGFIESLRAACIFYHETKDVEMIAHVDDLFVVGCLKDVQEVHRGLADAFEMKCTYAGPKTGNSEVEYLGRRIVFTENGLEFFGDPKHAAILLKETGLEMCSGNVQCCELTSYADTKLLDTLADDTRSYMPPTDARRHRSVVARVGCMATGRPDLDVAACTLAKTMAHPTTGDEWR